MQESRRLRGDETAERLEAHRDKGRPEGKDHREHHGIEARRSLDDEEFGIPLQEGEPGWLGSYIAPQGGELRRTEGGTTEASSERRSVVERRAYPTEDSTESTISKRDFSAELELLARVVGMRPLPLPRKQPPDHLVLGVG